jgi:putative membrane protein
MSKKVLNIISIIIPLAVATLFGIKLPLGEWTKSLPLINAFLNGSTAVLLIVALLAIKGKRIQIHRYFIYLSCLLGLAFLINYILYHISNDTTYYTGEYQLFYKTILLTHILLAIIEMWFVLRALYYGYYNDVANHRRIVRFAYPIWLYVSVTGVIIYVMINPYYV